MKKKITSMILLGAICAALITGCDAPKHALPPPPPAPPGAPAK